LIDSETKELSIDWEDEIVKGILVTKNKEITNEEFK
jgi:NAD/NADP transhydrogenase alpha subunit